jgi:hypothetical protein
MSHSGGKLIGIVFTKMPLPDLNSQQGTPQQQLGAGMSFQQSMPPQSTPTNAAAGTPNVPVMTNTNITPAILAQLQQTANMGLMNTANNPNVQQLQNALRQQQMMAAAAAAANMGSPAQGNAQQQQQGQGQQQQNMNGKI